MECPIYKIKLHDSLPDVTFDFLSVNSLLLTAQDITPMVGPLQSPAAHNAIPVSAPADDAQHTAHFIKSASIQINGHKTDFLVQPFDDRIFILVSQVEKMGTTVSQ